MTSTKILAYLTLVVALAVATIAAWFSITGIATFFGAAIGAVIVMAAFMELAKIVFTFTLHHFWQQLPHYLKWPLVTFVFLLMLVTSGGIFGFLSKGHIEQGNTAISYTGEIDRIDIEIKFHADTIAGYRVQLTQINEALAKYTELDRVTKGLRQREKFKEEITTLNSFINENRISINELEKERAPWIKKKNVDEIKLGPVKYLAELFGFDLDNDVDGKGKAVRLFIIIIMIPFDPLAIIAIMLFDWLLIKSSTETVTKKARKPDDVPSVHKDNDGISTIEKTKNAFNKVFSRIKPDLPLKGADDELADEIAAKPELMEDPAIAEQLDKDPELLAEVEKRILTAEDGTVKVKNENNGWLPKLPG